MRKFTSRTPFCVRFLAIGFLLFILLFAFQLRKPAALAQSTQGCAPIDPNVWGWIQGMVVYFELGNLSAEQRSAVTEALNSWTTANQQNNSRVEFQPAPPGVTPHVTFQNGSVSNTGPPGTENAAQTAVQLSGSTEGFVLSAQITFDPQKITDPAAYQKWALHELGHTMGLDDPTAEQTLVPGATVMNGPAGGASDPFNYMPTTVTQCDNSKINESSHYPPPPGPPPCSLPGEPNCGSGCQADEDCTCGGECMQNGLCTLTFECSPILIAVGGSANYSLTSPKSGVDFDLDADGIKERLAWTHAGDPVAFLVRDRNGNGSIDDGSELFGNHSILPTGERVTNGFEALAFYDVPANGGNGDSTIDRRDQVWPELKLWIDWNHNGLSEASELYPPAEFGLTAIALDYLVVRRQDGYGNIFRLKAKFHFGDTVRFGYDVYFSATKGGKPF